MAFSDMSENEIVLKIKEMNGLNGSYPDVVKQYFQEIYRRYYHQCYNISRYYGLNRQDAEDVVQESFIKFLKRVQTFDETKPFKPWIFKVVLNTTMDKFKENKKHRHIDMEVLTETPSIEQEKFVEEFPVRDSFNSIIIKLPEKLKKVVLLRNYTDMDLEAISKIIQLSVRQVHNLLNQAYETIKKELEENENGEKIGSK